MYDTKDAETTTHLETYSEPPPAALVGDPTAPSPQSSSAPWVTGVWTDLNTVYGTSTPTATLNVSSKLSRILPVTHSAQCSVARISPMTRSHDVQFTSTAPDMSPTSDGAIIAGCTTMETGPVPTRLDAYWKQLVNGDIGM